MNKLNQPFKLKPEHMENVNTSPFRLNKRAIHFAGVTISQDSSCTPNDGMDYAVASAIRSAYVLGNGTMDEVLTALIRTHKQLEKIICNMQTDSIS